MFATHEVKKPANHLTSKGRKNETPSVKRPSVYEVNSPLFLQRYVGNSALQPPPAKVLQRKCACEEDKSKLQRQAVKDSGGFEAPPVVHEVLASSGQPLDEQTRAFMEPRFRYNFGQVRVHTDDKAAESARAVNARAYTVGHHVVMRQEEYAPTTEAGRRLLAHELVHVIQQGGNSRLQKLQVGAVGDVYEREADRVAGRVVGMALPADGRGVERSETHTTHSVLQRGPTEGTTSADGPAPNKICRIRAKATPLVLATKNVELPEGTSVRVEKPLFMDKNKILWATTILVTDSVRKEFIGLRGSIQAPSLIQCIEQPPEVVTSKQRSKTDSTDPGKASGKENLSMGEMFRVAETLPIEGNPAINPRFLQNAVERVAIPFWGGHFYLYLKGMKDPIMLPRAMVALGEDPFAAGSGTIDRVYKTKEVADAVIKDFGRNDIYTYYSGVGGLIFPTVISDTTAPYLVNALRLIAVQEREDAAAAANLGVNLLLWYVGARFPIKAAEPSVPGSLTKGASASKAGVAEVATSAAAAGSGAKAAAEGSEAFTVVEIGAGDLKASIELAKKGGVTVVAVDPVTPAAEAVAKLQSFGGTFVKGTAEVIEAGSAHHVFQYFPWQIEGTGNFFTGGTWRLIKDTIRLLKPNGAAHFVTESETTALYLAEEVSKGGLRTVITETTVGAAAPGASGAGVPNFSAATKVWMVNIYK